VLDFLQRCENESFSAVTAALGGDMVCPSRWIDFIYRAGKSDSNFFSQIAKNIRPLVSCMCNDKKMLFFQSNKHWVDSLRSFAQLIWHLVDYAVKSDEKDEVITALIEQEDLVRAIVQWASFWYTNSCPGLLDAVGIDDLTMIHNAGRLSTRKLVKNVVDVRESIGTMHISLPENDIVSFTVGLIRRRKARGWERNDFITIHHLIVDAYCVDKDVIEGIVDLGFTLSAELERSILLINISREMILQKEQPSDTRVAFAIRAGLVEMCLTFMERFGRQSTNQNDIQTSLFSHIEGIFKAVHEVALHKKTWKAIRHKRQDIEEKLNHLETSIIHNIKCNEMLGMITSILDTNGAYCCHCNKSLDRKERFQCGGCNRMTYCSRSCQRSDWLNGHSRSCCKTITTDANCGQFQGRLVPITIPDNERDALKLEELEINNNMIQLKLFLDHAATILEQAKTLHIPLFDCIVIFDLSCVTPEITTRNYSEIYDDESEGRKRYEASRSMKNITCVFSTYNFIEGLTDHLGEPTAMLAMQRLFPCEWLTQKK